MNWHTAVVPQLRHRALVTMTGGGGGVVRALPPCPLDTSLGHPNSTGLGVFRLQASGHVGWGEQLCPPTGP